MISLAREKLLSELEQKIGYSFRSRALLDRALTHRSFANERVAQNCQHNEAMEFLGDSVLGFVVSAWLLERFPDFAEGKLSKIKAHLVSEASLVELAEEIDLGRYILLNRGEEKTGGRRKRALLADAYEALIGVIYVDGSINVAERFLRRELRGKLTAIDPAAMIGTDYKSTLQEKLQAMGGLTPEYAVIGILGPDHRRTFRIELRVTGRALAQAEGSTIKLAQQEAARRALAAPESLAAALAKAREPEAIDESNSADTAGALDESRNENTALAADAGADKNTPTEVEATAATSVPSTRAEIPSPLPELDTDAPLFAINKEALLDIDVDEPLRAIADEIEATHKANGAGGNATGAARESEDNMELSEAASRGATTEA